MGLGPYSTFRKPRARLKPISDKRRKEWPAREACVLLVFRRDNRRCRAMLDGCTTYAEHVHELLPRSRGGDPHDPAGCIAICAACHRTLHQQPAMAVKLGLTISAKIRAADPT